MVTLQEYLSTSYDPDVEYVDGVLVERNVGAWLHSLVQSNLIFGIRSKYPRVCVVPELRSQTSPTRYRLPDVCVLLAPPKTKYLLDAAFLAIEILSEDDSMTRMMEKLEEYERKGVPNIWLFDPESSQNGSLCRWWPHRDPRRPYLYYRRAAPGTDSRRGFSGSGVVRERSAQRPASPLPRPARRNA
jgi:Uma2 family endonuclease